MAPTAVAAPTVSASAPAHYEGGAWAAQPTTHKGGVRSWAQAAGRRDGPDGYRFGDGTRALLGVLRGKQDRGWKQAAGRTAGSAGYKFGDLTRVAVSNLFGDKQDRGWKQA